MTKLVIEHLEPKLWKWCMVEYKHISDSVGKENVIFTNIKSPSERKTLEKLGKVIEKSIKDIKLKNLCVLDPGAKATLTSKDRKFDYLLLGGILGDFPMRRRTKKELTDVLGYPARNLSNYQMSTNTAAYVAWKILHGTPISKMKFKRGLTVKSGECEDITLPFRFLIEDGKIFMPKGYIELIKNKL
jgi:ribosome biogenesis SPOUT family RNA methylase Rps3